MRTSEAGTVPHLLRGARFSRGHLLAIAGVCAAALSLTALSAPDACAVNTGAQGSTAMNLTIDETQIITEIPTEIPVAVKGDGTFSVPQNVHIRNHSVFAVHVPKVKVTVNGQPQFALVSKDNFEAGADERTLWTTVKAGTHELDLSTAAGDDGVDTQKGQWNMARHDKNNEAGPDKLHLTFDGAIKNASGLMSDAALTAVTVQWTLAAGEPADVPAGS